MVSDAPYNSPADDTSEHWGHSDFVSRSYRTSRCGTPCPRFRTSASDDAYATIEHDRRVRESGCTSPQPAFCRAVVDHFVLHQDRKGYARALVPSRNTTTGASGPTSRPQSAKSRTRARHGGISVGDNTSTKYSWVKTG